MILFSKGHLAKSKDTLIVKLGFAGGASGIQWPEARDAIKYPAVHRTIKSNLVQNVTCAEAEKCCYKRFPSLGRKQCPGLSSCSFLPRSFGPLAAPPRALLLHITLIIVIATRTPTSSGRRLGSSKFGGFVWILFCRPVLSLPHWFYNTDFGIRQWYQILALPLSRYEALGRSLASPFSSPLCKMGNTVHATTCCKV